MNIISFVKSKVKQFCCRIYEIGYRYHEQRSIQEIKKLCHFPKDEHMSIPYPYRIIGAEYMTIGRHFYSLSGLRLECIDAYNNQRFSPKLIIGDNVTFNSDCHVGVVNLVKIGNNVLIGSHVLITDHSHGKLEKTENPFNKREIISKGPVIIEDNVWIGENVCILPNVTIGGGEYYRC